MNNKLLEDLGENYQYAKTIVDNKVELMKLDVIETSATVVGKIISGFVLALLSFVILLIGLSISCILIAQALGSFLYALLIVGAIILILTIIIFVFRDSLIFNPVVNAFYNIFN